MKYIKTFEDMDNYYGRKLPAIPDILYHGQPPKYDSSNNYKRIDPVKFTKFDRNFKRFTDEKHWGFYFTPYKHIAYNYAEGGNVYVCKVNIKNPYYYLYNYSYDNTGLIKSATFITKADYDKLIKNGYDGVVLMEMGNEIGEIIALYPEQIEILKII
jgi:hypothetical protein